MTMLIYLDTNVYSRPFDNQNKPEIRSEADAFMDIVSEIKSEKFTVLCSDILMFEVYNILSEDKRNKVKSYLGLCSQHIDNSDKIMNLGQQIGDRCQIRARDALHIASAIIGGARYCLSYDKESYSDETKQMLSQFGKSLSSGIFFSYESCSVYQ